MNLKTQYKLLTFYKFVDIKDPHAEVEQHLQFCKDIGIKWRIYISEEWISATCSCNTWQYMAYRMFLATNEYFADIADIDIKSSIIKSHSFDRMVVKYRSEIVALGETVTQQEVETAYKKIPVAELKEIIDKEQFDDYAILDMRNTYEYKLGHFKGALPAGTINFREVDQMFDDYQKLFKDKKKVIMYCTGWVRCEKLSVMLNKRGIDNFYALDGWVVKYANTHNDGNRLGNLYTFDGLVSTRVGDAQTHTKIGTCIYTDHKTDHIENCRYSPCNARIICRKRDYRAHGWFCSKECLAKAQDDLLIKNEQFDPIDYKQLRQQISLGKLDKSDARMSVQSHLSEMIGERWFRHETSQKEDFIDKDILKEYM